MSASLLEYFSLLFCFFVLFLFLVLKIGLSRFVFLVNSLQAVSWCVYIRERPYHYQHF